MADTPAIAVVGHICLDIIPDMQSGGAIEPGRLVEVGAATIATGGAVANVGVALHRLGCKVHLSADVGDDAFGREIVALVPRDERAVTQIRAHGDHPTSYSIVISPAKQDRTFLHCPGANDAFDCDQVDVATFKDCRALHFGYPPSMKRVREDGGASLARLFERARLAGMITSLDMVLPDSTSPAGKVDWPAFLSRVLPMTDLFYPSVEELLFMLDRDEWKRMRETHRGDLSVHIDAVTVRSLAERVIELGASAAVIKRGSAGLMLRSSSRAASRLGDGWSGLELWQQAMPVKVVGTTGAGDCAIAGLLCAFAHDEPPAESLQFAAACGACSCEALDATSGIKLRDGIRSRIKRNWS